MVEKIRQTSIRFDRDADAAAGAELQAILDGLPRESMIAVVRAFSCFLHLANIAEDQHTSAAAGRTTLPARSRATAASRIRSSASRPPASHRRQ